MCINSNVTNIHNTINNISSALNTKNPIIQLVASLENDQNVNPSVWTLVYNYHLDTAGLYMVKHSAFSEYGVIGLSISIDVPGLIHNQQTDRSTTKVVRGVVETELYYLSSPADIIVKVYIDNDTSTVIKHNLKIVKLFNV